MACGFPAKMERGPPGLTVRPAFYGEGELLQVKGRDSGRFILEIPNEEIGKEQFGLAALSIHHKEDVDEGFQIEAKSAVLWDIKIFDEQWRRRGIGSEWIEFMKQFAKSQGAERFYAASVQTESEGFFVKKGFVPHHEDWWIMKEF